MKRYSKVLPPHFSMSSPAAHAEPPVAIRSLLEWDEYRGTPQKRKNPLDDDTVLPRQDSIRLHLKLIDSVLLLVRDNVDLSRQLADLSHGYKGGSQSQGENGSKKETSGIQADNDVDLAGRGRLLELGQSLREDVVGQVRDQGFGSERVSEDGLRKAYRSGLEDRLDMAWTYEHVQEGDTLEADLNQPDLIRKNRITASHLLGEVRVNTQERFDHFNVSHLGI